MSDCFATGNAGQPLEERVKIQAFSVDLREAVMACLSGGESRRWSVLELVERFKSLGVCASRASVIGSGACSNEEPEWILEPKSELSALLSGVRQLPLKEAKILSEEHKTVLAGRHRVPPQRRGLQNQGGGDTGGWRPLSTWTSS